MVLMALVRHLAGRSTRCLVSPGRRSVSYLLGIETSCDDTAAAVLDLDTGRVLSNVVSSQWELNAQYKGVMPLMAARAHADNIPHVVQAALEESGLKSEADLTAVAVTTGPGLAPCLGVGVRTAQEIALKHQLDFMPVNHLEAHVLVARMPDLPTERPEFPFLVLLVSGGHCCLVLAKGIGEYELLGNTQDDSIGEAYDKVARLLSLDTGNKHGGRIIEEMAALGDATVYDFPEPMIRRKDCDFSYSGLKTAMLREVKRLGDDMDEEIKRHLCASFQTRAVDHLVRRSIRACEWGRAKVSTSLKHLVVCGGVASNQYLRHRLTESMEKNKIKTVFPPAKYCTDNAVMIAWAAYERYKGGERGVASNVRYSPRWPLDQLRPIEAFNRQE